MNIKDAIVVLAAMCVCPLALAEKPEWQRTGQCYFIAVTPNNTSFRLGQINAVADTPCTVRAGRMEKKVIVLRKQDDPKIISINIEISKASCKVGPNDGGTDFHFNVPEENWDMFTDVTFVKLSDIATDPETSCEVWPSFAAVFGKPKPTESEKK